MKQSTSPIGRLIQADRLKHKSPKTGKAPETRVEQAARFGFLTEGALRFIENATRAVPDARGLQLFKAMQISRRTLSRHLTKHNRLAAKRRGPR